MMASRAHLSDDAYRYKAFVFTLLAERVPPLLNLENPLLGSFARRAQRLEHLVGDEQLALLAADDKELLVLCLEEPDADGQVNRHDPELDIAGVMSVQRVGNKNQEEIDMEYQQRRDGKADIAHLDDRVPTIVPDDATHRVEDDRVEHGNDDI